MEYNVLEEKLLEIGTDDGNKDGYSLPGVLALLSSSKRKVVSFSKLMPHQQQGWFCFLVQLAAIALHEARLDRPCCTEREWKTLLRSLTLAWPNDAPWYLIVQDLDKPAFFQPPIPEGTLNGFSAFSRPDENSTIDLLVLSKSHDVKEGRIIRPRPEHWIYSVITVQTMAGYPGRGHHQISRMNGGYGSRPLVTIISAIDWSSRFQRDLRVLMDNRNCVLREYPDYPKENGKSLLWLYPWDGETSFLLSELDPYYIEICRRLRLTKENRKIVLRKKTTKDCRINAKELHGITGDPWIPIDREKEAILTVGETGFRYDKLQRILFSGDYKRNACLRFHQIEKGDSALYAVALARGQGKTDGLHERVVPISPPARNVLAREEGSDKIAELSRLWIEDVNHARNKILKPSLLHLLQGGPARLNYKDQRSLRWLSRFNDAVDRSFFGQLWSQVSELEHSGPEQWKEKARLHWRQRLKGMAEEVYRKAKKGLPIPSASKYRAIAEGNRVFYGGFGRFCQGGNQ